MYKHCERFLQGRKAKWFVLLDSAKEIVWPLQPLNPEVLLPFAAAWAGWSIKLKKSDMATEIWDMKAGIPAHLPQQCDGDAMGEACHYFYIRKYSLKMVYMK